MADPYEEECKRREELAADRKKRLDTPVIYSLEVQLKYFLMEPNKGGDKVKLDDQEFKARVKFSNYFRFDVGSKNRTRPEAGDEENVGKTEEMASGYTTESDTYSSQAKFDVAKTKAENKKKADPRYFDPKKLLAQTSEKSELTHGEAPTTLEDGEFETDGEEEFETVESEGDEDEEYSYDESESVSELEEDEEETSVTSTDTIDPSALIFERDMKSIILCKEPFNMMYDLQKSQLSIILFQSPTVKLGKGSVPLYTLTEAVNRSVVYEKPATGVMKSTCDIFQNKEKIGTVRLQVKLDCHGPNVFHKINFKENPNDEEGTYKSKEPMKVHRYSYQDPSKGNQQSKRGTSDSQGFISGDISYIPPIITGDEDICSEQQDISSKDKRTKKNQSQQDSPESPEKSNCSCSEKKRKKEDRDPCFMKMETSLYDVMDETDSTTIRCKGKNEEDEESEWLKNFSKQFIHDLIAKNRRPFQIGSFNRKYILQHFPEYMPRSKRSQRSYAKTKSVKSKQKPSNDDAGDGTLSFLPLSENWMRLSEIQRIRKKSVRPAVRTSVSSKTLQTTSTNSSWKPVDHTMNSMSHVAITGFDMEKGNFVHSDDYSSPAERKQSNQSLKNKVPIFNTRHPRLDTWNGRENPLPDQPYSVNIHIPAWHIAKRLVEAIRLVGEEINRIGGDAEGLQCNYEEIMPTSDNTSFKKKSIKGQVQDEENLDPVLVEVEKGSPIAIPARASPYWEGHNTVCQNPAMCQHYLLLCPGYGYVGK